MPSDEGTTGVLTLASGFDRVSASLLPSGGAAATVLANVERTFAAIAPLAGFKALPGVGDLAGFKALPGFDRIPPSLLASLGIADMLTDVGIRHLRFAEYDYSILTDMDGADSEAANSVGAPYIKRVRTLSNRELAIWLTLITCLLLNISLVALKHSSRMAYLMTEEGVNPFDGSTVPAAFIYWAWLAYLKRSSVDK